ncbi:MULTISPECIES: hypothetical protein [unclassified Nocardiopsis]|uniref:hypothetical protein n=1 Tax=unclassified Nocardiopsis TaxID=2649073 RepID=UPI00135B239E|nr:MULTISPECIES: hypothetical protein [unclassified Nocardiopsis]
MTQVKRIPARSVLLAAGTASFVALGSGIAGAEALHIPLPDVAPLQEVAPLVERALVEGVAPTVTSLAPEGVGPIADSARSELQQSAHDPAKPAPDLSAPLPDGEPVRTPLGELPNPTSDLADAVAGVQDATGLDGDPHDTVGHDLGRSLEEGGHRAGSAVEGMAEGAGERTEATAMEVLPHTVESVYGLREQVDLPKVDEVVPLASPERLSEAAPLPDTSDLTSVTGGNTLSLNGEQAPALGDTLGMSAPVHQSAAGPVAPNMWDIAYIFGIETPDGVRDLMSLTPLTDGNSVSLGEEEALGMVGQRNLDEPLTTLPQSSPQNPGLGDLVGTLLSGDLEREGFSTFGMEPLNVDGPLADPGLPRLSGTGVPLVDDAADSVSPQLADAGLPVAVESVDTQTAEDLVAELGRGTDLLNDIDTSDLLSVSGGTAPQETPAGMTQHPTFMDLPGSEALPAVS